MLSTLHDCKARYGRNTAANAFVLSMLGQELANATAYASKYAYVRLQQCRRIQEQLSCITILGSRDHLYFESWHIVDLPVHVLYIGLMLLSHASA